MNQSQAFKSGGKQIKLPSPQESSTLCGGAVRVLFIVVTEYIYQWYIYIRYIHIIEHIE